MDRCWCTLARPDVADRDSRRWRRGEGSGRV